ncbi:MAG TPA: hypothetical protein VGE85_01705 [Terracidiphilus sp.]
MKYVSYVAFCAILLCCPTLRSQSTITLSADDVKFLSGCGVLQGDIKVIPKLPSDGQRKIMLILRKDGRVCSDIKSYKDTRDHLRKYTPPPSVVPMPPKGYDMDYFTKAEFDYVSKINNDLLEKLLQ